MGGGVIEQAQPRKAYKIPEILDALAEGIARDQEEWEGKGWARSRDRADCLERLHALLTICHRDGLLVGALKAASREIDWETKGKKAS